MSSSHFGGTDKEIAEANFNYWTYRVDYEMPTPDPRTLQMLGRAAYTLTKLNEAEQ